MTFESSNSTMTTTITTTKAAAVNTYTMLTILLFLVGLALCMLCLVVCTRLIRRGKKKTHSNGESGTGEEQRKEKQQRKKKKKMEADQALMGFSVCFKGDFIAGRDDGLNQVSWTPPSSLEEDPQHLAVVQGGGILSPPPAFGRGRKASGKCINFARYSENPPPPTPPPSPSSHLKPPSR